MRIEVNGEPCDLSAPFTVTGLLAQLALQDKPVAVERNTVIVPRAQHGSTVLEAGDKLEIVQFVGGG